MAPATKIIGLGTYIPERVITNDDVLELMRQNSAGYLSPGDLDTLMEKARAKLAKSGSVTRRWCRQDEYGPDMALIAAQRALDDAGISASEIDLIIYTGMSKAFVEPATGHVLRHELGALRANVIDTQDACTSFMKSMEIADSLIKTGNYRTVLIAAGERTFDWADFSCKTVDELAWKFGSLTIGDAAGAMVLQGTEEGPYAADRRHMRSFYRLADGEYSTCHIGLNYRVGDRYRLHSHSSRLIRSGLKHMMELVKDILSADEWKDIQYECLFIHDIGRMIDEMVLPALRQAHVCIPESYRSFYPEIGNIASASLPVAMDRARNEGRLKRGDLVTYTCPAAGVQAGVMFFFY